MDLVVRLPWSLAAAPDPLRSRFGLLTLMKKKELIVDDWKSHFLMRTIHLYLTADNEPLLTHSRTT